MRTGWLFRSLAALAAGIGTGIFAFRMLWTFEFVDIPGRFDAQETAILIGILTAFSVWALGYSIVQAINSERHRDAPVKTSRSQGSDS